MNKLLLIIFTLLFLTGCGEFNKPVKRIPVAKAGDAILYSDQIADLNPQGTSSADSTLIIQAYINKWARRELLYQKAKDNLLPELKKDIDKQIEEARTNLVIYQYQRQMMLERMDTLLTDTELENYYSANRQSFNLSSNIIKALFIKLPAETPEINKFRTLARSNDQTDLQQLETLCYQFADKFDDFNEGWVTFDRLSIELPQEIQNEENFLKRTTFYESSDSTFIYFISVRDYRLRSSLAPFEYVREDIKRIIWNSRRLAFLQSLENGIYDDAIRENGLIIYNK